MSLKPEAIVIMDGRYRCAKSGKRAFVTRRQAKDFAKGRKRKVGGKLQHVYWCSSCGGWHLTSAPLSDSFEMSRKYAFYKAHAHKTR